MLRQLSGTLEIELKREVSWSNVRDKLNIGLFDAAHLLSPVAIASSLGLGHVRVPIIAPFNLGLNGNAITVTPALFAELAEAAEADMTDPMVSARALARVVGRRKERHAEPLTFGMTFPFSNHNYQLRFWMAAGGVDPDEDVRLVVLPPPYMVDSLASGHVDGFCVGAPWNSVAVEDGVGRILHFGSEIVARASEKVLAVRSQWAARHPETVQKLIRALGRAAALTTQPEHRDEIARLISARIGVEPEVMGVGPVPSTEKALRIAGLSIDDIGLFELNEAFAVQVLAFLDHFGIADDDPRVNPWGGAIAIGHPLASSGVRLMTQLARQFAEHPEVRYGLTAMCVGIGMGASVIWENPNWKGDK